MKYRIFAIVLLLSLCLQLLTPAVSAAGSDLETTEPDQITESLLALQEEYPDGMPWTNSNPSPSYYNGFGRKTWQPVRGLPSHCLSC